MNDVWKLFVVQLCFCFNFDVYVSDWFMGYATKNRAEIGIFPKNYVTLKEAKIIQNG